MLQVAEKHIASTAAKEGPVPPKVTPIVWIFIGIISTLVLITILIGLVLRARCTESR